MPSEITKETIKDWNYVVTHFNPNYIRKRMKIDEYVIGLKNDKSFCYLIERKLRPLGSILGAPSIKFGIYYGHQGKDKTNKYRYKKELGRTRNEAFKRIKDELADLIVQTKLLKQFKDVDSIFSPMFKHKIMYVYNPKIMLPIFSDEHLKHFISKLKLTSNKTYEGMQLELLKYKNGRKYKNMDNFDFVRLLYQKYERPISKETIDVNDKYDAELNKKDLIYKKPLKNYKSHPEKKKKAKKDNREVYYYPRNPENSAIALHNARYKCENNKKHFCFKRRKNNTRYTEVHHLIPLCYFGNFDYDLDIPANIVSLCSSCHNEIHYGKNADAIIRKLYKKRKKELKKAKIEISENELLNMYHQINSKE